MFRPYRCQCEAARERIDRTCFAPSPQHQGIRAKRSSSAVAPGQNGSTFSAESKAEYRWDYRKIRSSQFSNCLCFQQVAQSEKGRFLAPRQRLAPPKQAEHDI